MTRLRLLGIVLALSGFTGLLPAANAAQKAAEATVQNSRGPQFAFADSSFVVVVPPIHGTQSATLLRSSGLSMQTPSMVRVSQPSFSEVAEDAPSTSLSSTSSRLDHFTDFPSKSWGHVLAGLGMIAFVALRRSVSL